MSSIEINLFYIVGIGSLAGGRLAGHSDQGAFVRMEIPACHGVAWVAGVCVYFYEAVSGMTDPPMQWGYPRTVEGFFHALSRGQYETIDGTNIFQNPARFAFPTGLHRAGAYRNRSVGFTFSLA